MTPRNFFISILIYVIFVASSTILCYQKQLLKTQGIIIDTAAVVYTGAVEKSTANSPVGCMGKCNSNDKCLAYFYSINTKECILHSTYNKYIKGSPTDMGWRYYITKDVAGRCHEDYLHYRYIDFCYDTLWIDTISFNNIKAGCGSLGGKLAAITSQEIQDYFELFLADRFDSRVCIDGTKQPGGNWMLDNGLNLTYFNWYPGQPTASAGEDCLLISTDDMMKDCQCVSSTSCHYVCVF